MSAPPLTRPEWSRLRTAAEAVAYWDARRREAERELHEAIRAAAAAGLPPRSIRAFLGWPMARVNRILAGGG